jgi:hypothetical protein
VHGEWHILAGVSLFFRLGRWMSAWDPGALSPALLVRCRIEPRLIFFLSSPLSCRHRTFEAGTDIVKATNVDLKRLGNLHTENPSDAVGICIWNQRSTPCRQTWHCRIYRRTEF